MTININIHAHGGHFNTIEGHIPFKLTERHVSHLVKITEEV